MNTEREIVRHIHLGIHKQFPGNFGSFPFDPEAVRELDRIIDETDTQIVISSSWRNGSSISELQDIFEMRGFQNIDAIIDKTPSFREADRTRGEEILEWIFQHSLDKYIIIDDEIMYDIAGFHNEETLCNTDPKVGFLRHQADKIITYFS
jgi:hypothetical protein